MACERLVSSAVDTAHETFIYHLTVLSQYQREPEIHGRVNRGTSQGKSVLQVNSTGPTSPVVLILLLLAHRLTVILCSHSQYPECRDIQVWQSLSPPTSLTLEMLEHRVLGHTLWIWRHGQGVLKSACTSFSQFTLRDSRFRWRYDKRPRSSFFCSGCGQQQRRRNHPYGVQLRVCLQPKHCAWLSPTSLSWILFLWRTCPMKVMYRATTVEIQRRADADHKSLIVIPLFDLRPKDLGISPSFYSRRIVRLRVSNLHLSDFKPVL